jgi:hypothetical protein
MPSLGLGLGIHKSRLLKSIDPQAQAHFDRVIADGGIVPSGLSGVNAFFTTIKSIYATSDITTAISVGLDAQVLGYKLGAGAGTTLGQAAQKLYSCSGSSGDVVQTTAASQPLLLLHSGENYYQGVGVAGNFVSTPNTTANDVISEDLELIVEAEFSNYTNQSGLIGKFGSSGNANYYFFTVNKILYLIVRTGGSLVTVNSAIITALTENQKYFLRVTRTNAGFVQFSYSENGIAYTIVTSISSTAGNLDASSIALTVGARTSTTDSAFCKIFSAKMIKNGNLIALFNPNQYNPANSQTQWTSSTGEIWTINTGTATTGYKGVLVDRTTIQSDRIDDSIQCLQPIWLTTSTLYSAIKFFNTSNTGGLIDSDTGNSLISRFEGIDVSNRYFAYQTNNIGNIDISSLNNRFLFTTSVRNAANSKVQINSLTPVTGTLSSVATTGFRLLANRLSTIAYFANANLNTLIISANADNNTVQTAMNTLIKSISNNPV